MIYTSQDEREVRLKICKACPVYQEITGSCGLPRNTLMKLMRNPNEKVEVNGRKFTPCGCPMYRKVSFKFAHCPANLWPSLINEDLKNRIRAITTEYLETKIITSQKRLELASLIQTIYPAYKLNSCQQCVRTELSQLIEALAFNEGVEMVEQEELIDQLASDLQTTMDEHPVVKKTRSRKSKKS
jgi:hypothetical protein